MNPVVHFEMPAENKDRMVNFYTNVFGWCAKRLGPEMGNYIIIQTTETEKSGFPKNPGIINGGFFEKSEENQYPLVVIAVDNIKESMKEVESAGGKVLGGSCKTEPDDIPGVGLYCAITDTEGNRVGMLQPNPMM